MQEDGWKQSSAAVEGAERQQIMSSNLKCARSRTAEEAGVSASQTHKHDPAETSSGVTVNTSAPVHRQTQARPRGRGINDAALTD